MAIVDMYLADTDGSYEADSAETTLEWLVYSNVILDYSKRIVSQGMIAAGSPLIVQGRPKGWYAFGTPYQLGNDADEKIYAKRVEVFDRKIIRGKGDFLIKDLAIVEIFNPENPLVQWRVRQTFTTDPKADEPKEEPSENDKFTVSIFNEWEDVPFLEDVVTGRPVLNSAGMPFGSPVKRRRKIPVISMTRKEYGNPVDKTVRYSNTVDGPFLIDSILSQYDGKIWTVTYNIKYRPEGWTTYLMDTGYYWCDPVTGYRYPILGEDDGLPVNEPVRLDGNGVPVPVDSDYIFNVGPFNKYETSLLADLRLPDPHSLVALPPPEPEPPDEPEE
ncbi:MAG: hypothetical protein FWE95_05265 [Planctomycetaceae bacterium]|nr:hypothetical protein [Planctomycetaceae bacterium]